MYVLVSLFVSRSIPARHAPSVTSPPSCTFVPKAHHQQADSPYEAPIFKAKTTIRTLHKDRSHARIPHHPGSLHPVSGPVHPSAVRADSRRHQPVGRPETSPH
ncbi:hypothetical protein EMIT0P294_10879 [Pseudomonas sp. IT-P294]